MNSRKTILVIGGAGYVGSHTNKELNRRGWNTIVYDNLVYGHRNTVKWGEFVLGDLADRDQLRLSFERYAVDAVIHFAAYAYVGESVTDPGKYYVNNVANTISLFETMREYGCGHIVFSSTCATYGVPESVPIAETQEQRPINPYGHSKLMIERILADYSAAYDLRYVALRYFNAAGADVDCEIGEDHSPETHLIPLVLAAAMGKRDSVRLFGTDYPTPDGTCVRDFIHVTDLADAHIRALEYLFSGMESDVFNLGTGKGCSVKEVVECARRITGKAIVEDSLPRRVGDPPVLVANNSKAREILGFSPGRSDLDTLVNSAWKWYLQSNVLDK